MPRPRRGVLASYTIPCYWSGNVRIELTTASARSTDATHYTIPRWCQPSELNAALSVFSGAYRPRIRDWQKMVERVGSAPTASCLQGRRSPQ